MKLNTLSTLTLENITKKLLYTVLFTPLLYVSWFYFPYISPKAYALRLLVGLAFFFWVQLMLRSKTHRPDFKNILVRGVIAFLLGYVITGFLGVSVVHSFFSSPQRSDGVIQFIVWVVYFLMLISVFRTKKDWQTVFGILVSVGVVASIIGLTTLGTYPRIFGTFGNPSFFGSFLLFAVGFTAIFFVKSFSPFRNPSRKEVVIPLIALVVFFVSILVMTQTRGVYIGLLAGIFSFVVLAHFLPSKSGRTKKMILVMDTLSIGLILFLAFVVTNPNSQLVNSHQILKRISNSVESDSVHERLTEWKIALRGFRDKPLVGWGAENFNAVSNKYYDIEVGLIDQWFDRPHNQTLQILAEGGIVLFSGYLLTIIGIIVLLFHIFKKDPILSSVVGAIFIAYFAQDFFLFDTYGTYIGFFTMLGFLYYLYNFHYPGSNGKGESRGVEDENFNKDAATALLVVVGILSAVFIYWSAYLPARDNTLILEYNAAVDAGADKVFTSKVSSFIDEEELKAANGVLEKSFAVTSPYLEFDIKKAAGWELLLKYLTDTKLNDGQKRYVAPMYEKIIPALEDAIKARPYDPQLYYLLGSLYRVGYEQFGKGDGLARSEDVIRAGLRLSPTRIEYVDAMGQTLLDAGKFKELEELMSGFVSRLDVNGSYRYLTLGNYYYLIGKLDLALEQYVLAQEHGYTFVDALYDRDYDRYLQAAQATNNFEKAAALIQLHLEKKGPNADNYFNLAVAEIKLGRKEEARGAFQKALELDPASYQQYANFFQ